jgi:hypothetical protein
MFTQSVAFEQVIARERLATSTVEWLLFGVLKEGARSASLKFMPQFPSIDIRVRTCRWRCSRRANDLPQCGQLEVFELLWLWLVCIVFGAIVGIY